MKIYPKRHVAEGSQAFSSYWVKEGFLYKNLPKNVNLREADDLVPLYMQVDDLGDALIEEHFIPNGFAGGMGIIHQLIEQYPNVDRNSLSETTKIFLEQVFHVPDFLDEELLLAGAQFCNRTGTSGLSTLRNYCLMGGYESSAINKPLIFTGALKKGAVKRLTDTVEFWVNVTEQNGLSIKSKGFYDAVTTRLIHSFSRKMIEKQPEWKSEHWGRPLNQWDMLATNLGFSIAFIDGLTKLGIQPSDKERSGVLHVWKYIGYLMGIPVDLLPDTVEQAVKQLYLWSVTQKGADEDSVALAHSLYEEPMTVTFSKSERLKKFIRSTNLGYNQLLLGAESCAKLGLGTTKMIYWIKILKRMNALQSRLMHKNKSFYKFSVDKGRKEHLNVRDLYLKEKN